MVSGGAVSRLAAQTLVERYATLEGAGGDRVHRALQRVLSAYLHILKQSPPTKRAVEQNLQKLERAAKKLLQALEPLTRFEETAIVEQDSSSNFREIMAVLNTFNADAAEPQGRSERAADIGLDLDLLRKQLKRLITSAGLSRLGATFGGGQVYGSERKPESEALVVAVEEWLWFWESQGGVASVWSATDHDEDGRDAGDAPQSPAARALRDVADLLGLPADNEQLRAVMMLVVDERERRAGASFL